MQGIEPKDKEIWDLGAVDIASEYARGGRRINAGSYDFTTITQAWLRTITLEWARRTDPAGRVIRDTIKATTIASAALERRAKGGHDPRRLGFDDMNAVMTGLRDGRKPDGELISSATRRTFAALFFQMLEFGRPTGLMDDVPGTFSRHQSHTVPRDSHAEDYEQTGKAIPEYVIAQLDRHLATLGTFLLIRGLARRVRAPHDADGVRPAPRHRSAPARNLQLKDWMPGRNRRPHPDLG